MLTECAVLEALCLLARLQWHFHCKGRWQQTGNLLSSLANGIWEYKFCGKLKKTLRREIKTHLETRENVCVRVHVCVSVLADWNRETLGRGGSQGSLLRLSGSDESFNSIHSIDILRLCMHAYMCTRGCTHTCVPVTGECQSRSLCYSPLQLIFVLTIPDGASYLAREIMCIKKNAFFFSNPHLHAIYNILLF